MALPWIKVYGDFVDHPRTLNLCADIGDPLAWAHLIALWTWCAKYAEEGLIEGRDPVAMVESAGRWTGARGVLVGALQASGWLAPAGENGFAVIGWAEHQAAHIERAADDAARKRKARKTAKSSGKRTADGSRNGARPSADGPQTGALAARVEERRGEETRGEEKKNLSGADAPAPVDLLGNPLPPDKPAVVHDEPDCSEYIERFREVFNSPAAKFTKEGKFAWRGLRKAHGHDAMMDSLEGLALDPWVLQRWVLKDACSQTGVERGLKALASLRHAVNPAGPVSPSSQLLPRGDDP